MVLKASLAGSVSALERSCSGHPSQAVGEELFPGREGAG